MRGLRGRESVAGSSREVLSRVGVGSAAVAYMGRAFRSVANRHPQLITLVALTQFARSRFLADGLTRDKSSCARILLPTSGPDWGPARGLLYVGRLSAEKGVDTIVRAAGEIKALIEVVGDGPEAARLREFAPRNVVFSGRVSREDVATKLRRASAILAPCVATRGFP